MDKLTPQDGQSLNIVADNIERLREIFPTAFAEGRVDFEALKQCLGECVDERTERYSFTWHGKRCAHRIAQTPSAATLLPCPDESLNWDSTQNIFIEGDNLEVLKLLQKSYHRKVKMIYIDPPYNTGKEFIYPDNYQDNLGTYLKYTGQIDGEGCKLSPNTESGGRYHTNWLNMMYPRLILARNLLRDDGVMFVSIDEHEISNLLSLMNEIFGEENFVECLVYDKKAAPKGVPPVNMIVGVHEYIACFQRSEQFAFIGKPRSSKGFSNPDGDPNGAWRNTNCKSTTKDTSQAFSVTDPKTGIAYKDTWAHSPQEMERLAQRGVLIFPQNPTGQVRKKEYFSAFKHQNIPIKSSLGLYDAQSNTALIQTLFGETVFPNTKHINLITDLIKFTATGNDLVVDLFAGSGTTGHAVAIANQDSGSYLRSIQVQLPEPCDQSSNAFSTGFPNIAEIAKQRLRLVFSETQHRCLVDNGINGFKVFKLSSSNIKPWDPDCDAVDGALLDAAIDNIKPERSQLAVLYELLLKYGLDLASAIEIRTIADRCVFIVANGALVVCLERGISLEVVRGIAALKTELQPPLMRVVFRDSGFDNDVLKTNALQILTQAGIPHVKSL